MFHCLRHPSLLLLRGAGGGGAGAAAFLRLMFNIVTFLGFFFFNAESRLVGGREPEALQKHEGRSLDKGGNGTYGEWSSPSDRGHRLEKKGCSY